MSLHKTVTSMHMNPPSGFLLVNKPAGMTSHDVIDQLRRITGIRKIGHAGTLDPFATGLLIVAVGREATREISKFVGLDKAYEAEFVLGATTETLDSEGEVIEDVEGEGGVENGGIEAAMASLTGPIKQIPPMYSAIKQKGKKLYELARQGQTVEREPRNVVIHRFDLVKDPWIEEGLMIVPIQTRVSSGTYIRALARDLAEKLGTTGYVRALHRSSIGSFSDQQAVDLHHVTSENWQTLLKNINISNIDEQHAK